MPFRLLSRAFAYVRIDVNFAFVVLLQSSMEAALFADLSGLSSTPPVASPQSPFTAQAPLAAPAAPASPSLAATESGAGKHDALKLQAALVRFCFRRVGPVARCRVLKPSLARSARWRSIMTT